MSPSRLPVLGGQQLMRLPYRDLRPRQSVRRCGRWDTSLKTFQESVRVGKRRGCRDSLSLTLKHTPCSSG